MHFTKPRRRAHDILYAFSAFLIVIWVPRASAQKEATAAHGRGVGPSTESTGHVSRQDEGHDLNLLKSCYNHNYTRAPLGFVRWLHGADTRLYLYRGWWSAHAPPAAPLTVFTMASLDRLALLEAQCRSFAGPHVAAVYLPLRVVVEGAEEKGEGGMGLQEYRKRGRVRGRGIRGASAGAQRGGGSGGGVAGGGGDEPGGGAGGVLPGYGALGWLSDAHQAQIRKAERKLQELFDRLEVAATAPSGSDSDYSGSCAPRLMLFVELVADPQLLELMPTNALRNAAMLAVRTPLSLMLDVDLSLSASLSALVRGKDPDRLLDLERSAMNRTLAVLAAWETTSRMPEAEANAMTDAALKGPKAQLSKLWKDKSLQEFAWSVYRKGHGPTKHGHWLHAQEPYQVRFREGYEPWGVLARLSDPGYDEQFRGWVWDKVMHVATLAYLNFSFVVQHDTWAIHRPHKLAAAAAIALKQHDKAASADLLNAFDQHMRIRRRTGTAYQHYKHYAELKYTTARQAMRTAAYVPYQGPPFLNCLESLPWWRVPTEVLRSEAGRGGFEGWVAPGVGPEDDRGVPLPWPPPWRLVRLRQQQQQR